jgi:hypothetical protein
VHRRRDRLLAALGLAAVIGATIGGVACATLRLNGCRKRAACGAFAAYSCADQLICADEDGQTLRSEPITTSRDPCHICRRGLE